jgi:ApaG protein
MTDLSSELAPVSEAVTNNIRVEVLSRHAPENSRPANDEWVFQYTIRITNEGSDTVQLLSRHWIITDALENVREVDGPGVVGQQPVLGPGESFKYSSWCPLKTPTGVMRGTFLMANDDGKRFAVDVAPFALRARYSVHCERAPQARICFTTLPATSVSRKLRPL